MFKDKKLIIFDLDGTLIDSLGIWSKVDAELVKTLTKGRVILTENEAYELRRASLSIYGEGSEAYVLYCGDILKKYGVTGLTAEQTHTLRYDIAQNFLRTQVKWICGAADFVLKLKRLGFKLALCTTTRRRNVNIYSRENECLRSKFSLEEVFDMIVTRDEVTKTKPDPEAHKLILKALGVEPKDALMVEDAIAGVLAAREAGIETIVIEEPHSLQDLKELTEKASKIYKSYKEMNEDLDKEI